MAVKLRLTRMGRRHRPFFRLNAVDSRTPRDGKVLEKLGHYDPIEKDKDKQIVLNAERIKYWLEKGAIPSDTVSEILLRKGIRHKYAQQKTARRAKARVAARAKGKLFTKTEKIQAEKKAKAAEEKLEAENKAKAVEEKAKAAEEKLEAEKKAKEAEEKTKAAEEKLEAGKKAKEAEEKAAEKKAESSEEKPEATEDKT